MESPPDDGAPAPDATTETTEQRSDSAPEIPEWFQRYQSEQNKEMAKLRRQLKEARSGQGEQSRREGDPPALSAQHTEASQDDQRAEMTAALRWGEIKSRLTDGARKELEGQLEEGGSFREVVRMAEMLARFGSKGQTSEPPPNEARSGARTSPASYPQSYAEWQQLGLKARQGDAEARRRYDALMRDPDFIEKFRSLK